MRTLVLHHRTCLTLPWRNVLLLLTKRDQKYGTTCTGPAQIHMAMLSFMAMEAVVINWMLPSSLPAFYFGCEWSTGLTIITKSFR